MKHYNMEEIFLYLDGEMSSMEKRVFEDHILICQECASKLEKARAFMDVLRIEDEEPPIDIASLAMEKIDKKRKFLPFFYGIFLFFIGLLTLPVLFGIDRAVFFYYIIYGYLDKIYLISRGMWDFLLKQHPAPWVLLGAGFLLIPLFLALRKLWRST